MWERLHLEDTARVLRDVMRRPPLRNAEIAFALVVTSEAAFTVTLGVVSFRSGGAAGVGLVALLRMLPSAVGTALITPYADRTNRVRVLVVVVAVRAAARSAPCGLLLASDAPLATVYGLAVVATIAMAAFRPVHSALLPALCADTDELTSANVVRGRGRGGRAAGRTDPRGRAARPRPARPPRRRPSPRSRSPARRRCSALHDAPTIRPAAPARAHLGRELVEGLRAVAHQHDLRLVFGLGFAQSAVRGAMNVFVVVARPRRPRHRRRRRGRAVGCARRRRDRRLLRRVAPRRQPAPRRVAGPRAGAVGRAHLGARCGARARRVGLVMLAVVGTANAVIDVPLFSLPVRLASDAVLARAFGVFEAMISLGVGLGSILGPALIGAGRCAAGDGRDRPHAPGRSRCSAGATSPRSTTGSGVREDEIRALRRTPMLGLLPVPIIEHLAGRLVRRSVPAGTTVVEQGTPGDRVYVIARGEAEVIGDGRQVLTTLGEGDGFGEVAVVDRITRTATGAGPDRPRRCSSWPARTSWPPSAATAPRPRPPEPPSTATSRHSARWRWAPEGSGVGTPSSGRPRPGGRGRRDRRRSAPSRSSTTRSVPAATSVRRAASSSVSSRCKPGDQRVVVVRGDEQRGVADHLGQRAGRWSSAPGTPASIASSGGSPKPS